MIAVRSNLQILFAWLLVVLCLACDAPVDTGDPCGASGDPVGSVDGGIQCGEPFSVAAPAESSGRFAIKVVQYIHLNAAGIVETDALGWAIGYADLRLEAGQTVGSLELKMCHLEIPKIQIPGQPEPAIFSIDQEKLDQHVDSALVPFTLSEPETCAACQSDPAVILVAAQLKNRLSDPLPWDLGLQFCNGPDADGCHFDADDDGQPGVTIRAQNIPVLDIRKLYATMRAWVAFDGIVAHPDLLLGAVSFGLDLQVLGCHINPLGGGPERECADEEVDVLVQITPDFTQTQGQESSFMARRVDNTIDCPTVIARADELFGR